jgi:N6-adenosine-specific RNA methylase IME4
MSKVKRSAQSNYSTMTMQDIINLPVKDIAADNSVLALWVPSSMIAEGLQIMSSWGYSQKQIFIWVKNKKFSLELLKSKIFSIFTKGIEFDTVVDEIAAAIDSFNLNEVLAFGMGRLFRQTHELALIGTRGKVYGMLENKSQRSVCFDPVLKHSAKPEFLQDRLDLMFPDPSLNKLEMFARRDRKGYTCVGNEAPSTFGEDIRDSIERLKNA